MITNYSRPQTLQEALLLLARPNTYPMGGGTWLNQKHDENFEVVDLQALGLTKIQKIGTSLEIDACVTLQQLYEDSDCPQSLKKAIKVQSGLNIRNAATVAGSLVASDGRSAFTTVMLSLDAKLLFLEGSTSKSSGLGEFLPLRPRYLVAKITIPLNVQSSFESVSRSPMDKPIVCVSITKWTGGRTRVVLGGWGDAPVLAMDGTESDGVDIAAANAYQKAGDEWATSAYRAEVAAVLSRRCLDAFINH